MTFPEVSPEVRDSLELTHLCRFGLPPHGPGFPLRLGLCKGTGNGNPAHGLAPCYWLVANPGAEGGKCMVAALPVISR